MGDNQKIGFHPLGKWALILLPLLAYWPISSLQQSLKWDMIDTLLPWRHYMSECLRNGYFPFWLPFQQGGYPLHADVRSTWNPEALFSTFFLGRDMYALHFSLLFYFILAGFGMRQFLTSLGRSSNSALLFGLAYPLCGYMVGQAQDIPRIAAAAILPWVLHSWWKMRAHPTGFRFQAAFALWMHFMLTSGYQALAIVLNYLLLFLFLSEFIHLKRNRSALRSLFQSHLVGYLLFVLLSLPLLYSLWESSDFVARFREGVSIDQALDYPFSPASFSSFFCPWCIDLSDPFFATDISMRNGFVGILVLILSSIGLASAWNNRRERILLLAAVLCATAALGHFLPVRMWLFNWVPLMKLFKTPAYFILPSILVLFALAAAGFDQLKNPKQLLPQAISLGLLLATCLFLGGWKFDFHSENALLSFASRAMLQVGIAALFLGLYFRWRRKTWLALCVLLELLIALQIQLPITATQPNSPRTKQTFTEMAPLGFGLQPNRPLAMNTSDALAYQDLYRNNALFSKRVSLEGFNSFYFDSLSQLEKDSSGYHSLTENPLCWLPKAQIDKNSQRKKQHQFWTDDNRQISFIKSKEDYVELNRLNPETIEIKASVQESGVLCLSQTNYPGWEVRVNGVTKEILAVNTGFMGVLLESGVSTVEFKFNPVRTKIALLISSILWITLLLLVAIPLLGYQKVLGIFTFLIVSGVGIRYAYSTKMNTRIELAHDFEAEIEKGEAEVWIVSEDLSLFSAKLASNAIKDWTSAEDLFDILPSAKESRQDTLLYFNGSARYLDSRATWVQTLYPELIKENARASYSWQKRYRKVAFAVEEKQFNLSEIEFTAIESWKIEEEKDRIVMVRGELQGEAKGKLVIHWKRGGKTQEWYGKSFDGKAEIKMALAARFKKGDEVEIYYWNINTEDNGMLKTQSGLY